jgi:hypothetical protein
MAWKISLTVTPGANYTVTISSGGGYNGAVRIIWGTSPTGGPSGTGGTRAYPVYGTQDATYEVYN